MQMARPRWGGQMAAPSTLPPPVLRPRQTSRPSCQQTCTPCRRLWRPSRFPIDPEPQPSERLSRSCRIFWILTPQPMCPFDESVASVLAMSVGHVTRLARVRPCTDRHDFRWSHGSNHRPAQPGRSCDSRRSRRKAHQRLERTTLAHPRAWARRRCATRKRWW